MVAAELKGTPGMPFAGVVGCTCVSVDKGELSRKFSLKLKLICSWFQPRTDWRRRKRRGIVLMAFHDASRLVYSQECTHTAQLHTGFSSVRNNTQAGNSVIIILGWLWYGVLNLC